MKFVSHFFLLTFLMCGIAESSFAKPWRGLMPLRSTRADVLRTIGECADQKEACRFTLVDEDVYILLSSALPSEYRECVAKLPEETVMFVAIKPRKNLKLSELHLERRNLQFFNPSTPTDP